MPDIQTITKEIKTNLYSWTECGIHKQLLSAITDNQDIEQGLYPSPRVHVSTTKGGGKWKAMWQWKLAVHMFQNHQKYSEVFAHALKDGCSTSKLQNSKYLEQKDQTSVKKAGIFF